VSLIGGTHLERDGHHYVNDMSGMRDAEQEAFLTAHPNPYHRAGRTVPLTIRDGGIALGSLVCTRFAADAEPNWSEMRSMGE
jgi:hypothetical protein|tara:strand:+ start:807 stop:1052 length:246 start_codon:yes stop_codon:yes gene_type:complete